MNEELWIKGREVERQAPSPASTAASSVLPVNFLITNLLILI